MRKIAIVTGTRAEYGLLYWLMHEIKQDSNLELQLIVTGMHLSPEFGLTYQVIEQDGFCINEKVEMLLSSDSAPGITKSIGLGVIGFADSLDRLKPDILVLLGDRFESLAAAQAAMIARIPIAHLHGGEATEGLIDEPIRHAITKMSHFHFVAAEPYRKRVIQLGETPNRVLNYGATGLENITRLKLMEKGQLNQSINFTLGDLVFLITYHPVTLNKTGMKQSVLNLLDALKQFNNASIIFTQSNADTDGRIINELIESFVSENPAKTAFYESLGQLRYLSAIKHADIIIGNSSSGIIEVPAFKKPTVNIGERQQGRLFADSIISCDANKQSIVDAINKALSEPFQKKLQTVESLYGIGNVSVKIKDYLKSAKLENVLKKKFYDLKESS
ncbi:MAG: UDP-N-acetylglucosamine 2-epimerase (hydrolyzing) [Methylococcales bacterium]|jgi:UDP-hydrolysing UDP-N-acetyl-D-glucosamine 2-epimerase|nr:UDP-N-acetylglucosamine 2-epimerase (hydrolyzing) [Methylococcales bacterium]MBT7410106.1 UDP-N-acetylglucosamine 2-epimerase (hydrolyzing) [Methylococcales bacterium]